MSDSPNPLVLTYKVPIISAIAVIIIGVFAYGAFSHFRSKQYHEYGNQLFAFSQNELAEFKEKKLPLKDFMEQYENLTSPMGSYPSLGLFNLQVSDLLMERKATTENLKILEKGLKTFKAPIMRYFYALRLAALYEDQQNYPQAIKTLEDLLTSPHLEEKIYLDLGRLHKLAGNFPKAKDSFEWVVEKSTLENLRQMAKLYLSEMK